MYVVNERCGGLASDHCKSSGFALLQSWVWFQSHLQLLQIPASDTGFRQPVMASEQKLCWLLTDLLVSALKASRPARSIKPRDRKSVV